MINELITHTTANNNNYQSLMLRCNTIQIPMIFNNVTLPHNPKKKMPFTSNTSQTL